MTHTNISIMLRRASERFTAGVGAVALTACLLAVSDARASTAESIYVGPSITVKYEIDALKTAEGTRQVYRKLKQASRSVCGVNDGGRVSLQTQSMRNECYDATLAEAVRKVDRPQLTALHQAATTRRLG